MHTFNGGCKGPGDYMDLAPPSADYTSIAAKEKEIHKVCPVNLDDCKKDSGKKTPIHSFMSYADVSLLFMTFHEDYLRPTSTFSLEVFHHILVLLCSDLLV